MASGNAGMALFKRKIIRCVSAMRRTTESGLPLQDSNGHFQSPAVIIDQYTKGPLTLTCVDETLYLVYADNTKSKIWVTKSTDGQRWSKAYELDKPADEICCRCCTAYKKDPGSMAGLQQMKRKHNSGLPESTKPAEAAPHTDAGFI